MRALHAPTIALALALGLMPALGSRLARAMPLDGRTALVLPPDGRAQPLRHVVPAGGPLQRHSARPGAWYTLVYLPMHTPWPMQLQLEPTGRGHDLHLLAMDAAPDDAPTVVLPMPVESEARPHGRPPRWRSRFALPARSTAPGFYVLIEQWRSDGEPPAPLWVRFTTAAPPPARQPWWLPQRTQPAGDGEATAGPRSPPSPLTRQDMDGRIFEVPIQRLPLAAETGGWR